jgi:hypothetical protein
VIVLSSLAFGRIFGDLREQRVQRLTFEQSPVCNNCGDLLRVRDVGKRVGF